INENIEEQTIVLNNADAINLILRELDDNENPDSNNISNNVTTFDTSTTEVKEFIQRCGNDSSFEIVSEQNSKVDESSLVPPPLISTTRCLLAEQNTPYSSFKFASSMSSSSLSSTTAVQQQTTGPRFYSSIVLAPTQITASKTSTAPQGRIIVRSLVPNTIKRIKLDQQRPNGNNRTVTAPSTQQITEHRLLTTTDNSEKVHFVFTDKLSDSIIASSTQPSTLSITNVEYDRLTNDLRKLSQKLNKQKNRAISDAHLTVLKHAQQMTFCTRRDLIKGNDTLSLSQKLLIYPELLAEEMILLEFSMLTSRLREDHQQKFRNMLNKLISKYEIPSTRYSQSEIDLLAITAVCREMKTPCFITK
ncbi:unnamed protein product, partial [Didymodactylos carnosus]